MRLDYRSLLNRAAWILLLLLLPTWALTEFLLVRWGQARYPINTYLSAYTNKPTDLIFLGDSRMSAGINPLVLDQKLPLNPQGEPVLSSHNLGVEGTSFGIYYLILKRLIEQNKTPRVVIVGYVYNELTETFFFEGPDLAEVSTPKDWSLLKQRSLEDMDAFLDLALQSVSRVYRYRFHIRNTIARRAEGYLSAVSEAKIQQPSPQPDPGTAALGNPTERAERPEQTPQVTPEQRRAEQQRGFRRNLSLAADLDAVLERERSDYRHWFWDPEHWNHDPQQTFLADMIALSQAHGIELIVVKMPTTQLYTQVEARSPYVSDYEQRLHRYLETHGVAHFDFSQAIEDRYLWDTIHLNPEGAEKFTTQLYRQVIRPHLDQWVE